MLIADACAEPLPVGSVSHVKTVPVQQIHDIRANLNAEKNDLHNELREITLGQGNIVKGKTGTGCSLNLSQISGPEEKSKTTPLSQIGFRDPASDGGGQQLTLLSIEVALVAIFSIHYDCCSCEMHLLCLRLF